MPKKYYLFFFFLLTIGCQENKEKNSNAREKLTVATAANVQFAIKEMEIAFEAKNHIDLVIILGSSGKLTAQIEQGAPYDLFLSADEKYPEKLYKDGFSNTPPKVYALGNLVLWSLQKELDLDTELSNLATSEIKKIGLANPKNAPYGTEAVRAIHYFNLHQKIKDKLVFGESIAQTNQYVLTQNCEVGFTAKSVVLSPQMKGKGNWIDVPLKAYHPIRQSVIITKYGAEKNAVAAKKFYDFLFSSEAIRIFEKYGYTMTNDE